MTDLSSLDKGLREVYHRIKARHNNHLGPLHWFNKRPWYLVIGSHNCGKSAFVKNANLDFIGQGEFTTPEGFHPSWWIGSDAIITEVSYQQNPVETDYTPPSPKALRWCKPPVAGIIVTVNVDDLLTQQNHSMIKDIQNQLQTVSELFGAELPLYIVITKMDLINGFTEFFSDLEPNEQTQPWGITLEKKSKYDPEAISRSYKFEFNKLLERLNARLILRLQQERSLTARVLINDFPLQMESLKGTVGALIEKIDEDRVFVGRGIYFCSAIQQGVPIDRLKRPLSQVFDLQAAANQHLPLLNKAFFIHELFTQILLPIENDNLKSDKINQSRNIFKKIYAGSAIALVTTLTLFWSHGLREQIDTARSMQKALAQYVALAKKTGSSNFNQLVVSLDTFVSAMKIADNHSTHHINLSGLQQSTDLIKQTHDIYQKILTKRLLPILQSDLASNLTHQTKEAPLKLYDTLQVYLMLAKPKHRQVRVIDQWIKNHSKSFKVVSSRKRKALHQHLHYMLGHSLPPLPFDINAIKAARDKLTALPKSMLALLILKNEVQGSLNDPFNLKSDRSRTFSYASRKQSIPNIYTEKYFHQIYFNSTDHACRQAIQGNWVIGPVHKTKNMDVEDLALQVRPFYINSYIKWWEKSLNKIAISPFDNLSRASRILMAMGNDQLSPLITIIKHLQSNTTLTSAHASIEARQIHRAFRNITELLEDNHSPSLKNIITHINGLANYIDHIQNSPDPDKASFDIVKERFTAKTLDDPITQVLHDAKIAPAPISKWLTQLTENTWALMIVHAHKHINSVWQSSVLPVYGKHIENRFPLFSDSTNEVDLDDFAHFFNSGGLFDTFSSHYITPFLNTTPASWANKKLNGLSMGFDDKAIQQFERAKIIRMMFFSEGRTYPRVEFVLRPIAIKRSVKNVQFELNGKRITDTHRLATNHHLVWPSRVLDNDVKISFLQYDGQLLSDIKSGQWALFRLLTHSHVHPTIDPRYFDVIFDLNGNAAKYQLLAKETINPFIPGIIESFRCPEKV